MVRFACYVRVSTIEQAKAKEGSISSQVQRLLEYLKGHGVSDYILYQEEGRSGKDTNRPQYQQLIMDIKSGLVQNVICTELSRISRSVIDFHLFLELCTRHNVGFVSLREQLDTASASGRLIIGILSVFAQFEREQISERTSANMLARSRRGLWNGGYIYGYLPRPGQPGHLDVVDAEAVIVNLIFDQYLTTGSFAMVAKYLNDRGYQTREYESRNGRKHRATPWSHNTIIQMLHNPAFAGYRQAGENFIKAVWAPIVIAEKWQKVQELLAHNYRVCGNSISVEYYSYLFSGMLFCSNCQTFLENGSGTSRNGVRYFYYRHPKTSRQPNCPFPPSLPAAELDAFLCAQLRIIFDDAALLNMVYAEMEKSLMAGSGDLQARFAEVEKEMRECSAELKGLLSKMALLDEVLVKNLVLPRLQELSARKEALGRRKSEIEVELARLESTSTAEIRQKISSLSEVFDELERSDKLKILRQVVEKVELGDGLARIFLLASVHPPVSWLPETQAKRIPSIDRPISVYRAATRKITFG